MEDTSWIREIERIHQICENPSREIISSIRVHSVFVNQHHSIDSVEHSVLPVHSNVITPEEVSQLKKSTKYVLKDILLFHIPLEAEEISSFLQTDMNFLKTCNVLEDIPIPPSIFVFHSIHSLYLFFHEPKSILMKTPRSKKHSRQTRRVAFCH